MRVGKYRNGSILSPAATDGYNLYLDEEKLGALPEESLNFILLHELFHIILRHRYPRDMPMREGIYWNIAFDLTANWLILHMQRELKHNKLPTIPVADTCLTTDDLSRDHAYMIAESFVRQAEQQGVLSGNPPPIVHIRWKSFEVDVMAISLYICDVLNGAGSDAAPNAADVEDLLSSCAKSAGLGGLPEYLTSLMEDALPGRKLPWFLIFKRYLEAAAIDDFDFMPPDKRMLYKAMILPDSTEDISALNNALIVLDVSSSVEKPELLAQIWQINSVLSELRFTGNIISFAGDVYQEASLTDKPSLKRFIDGLKVGGGTDWAKVVEDVKRRAQIPKPIVVFTDGYFYSFTQGLSNVIFITQDSPPPTLRELGKVIQIKL